MSKFTTKQLAGVNIPNIEDVVNYLNPSDAEGVRIKAVRDTEYRKGLEGQFREAILTDNQKSPVSMISTDEGERELDQTSKKFETQYGLEDETPVELPTDEAPVIEEESKEGGYTFEEAQEVWGNDFTGIRKGDDGMFYPDSSAYGRAGIKGMGEDLSEDIDEMDQTIQDEYNKWQSYNVETDPAFISQTNSITQQYDILRRQMKQKNESRQKAIQTMGYRHGTRQYAGAIQMGIEGEELKQASQRLTDITTEEMATKSAARIAFENNAYIDFSRGVDALQTIRKNKADALSAYNDTLIAANKAMQDQIKEEREAEKDERERQATTTESLSDLALTLLTGDSEADMATLQSLADQYGIDVNMLSSQVVKLQTDMESELMTTDLKEYQYARQQGYENSFKEWQKEQKGEQLVSGAAGSKWRLDPKTGKYSLVVPPIWKGTSGGGEEEELTGMDAALRDAANEIIGMEKFGLSNNEAYFSLVDELAEDSGKDRNYIDKLLIQEIQKVKGEIPQTAAQVEENIGSDFVTDTEALGGTTQADKSREVARQKAIKKGLTSFIDPTTGEIVNI